jgi:hypothetical protein
MFAVYSRCQPFRRFQLFPPDLSKFREKWTAWTARQTGFHTALVQPRSRTSVPALWLNCSRPNSDQYRLGRFPRRQEEDLSGFENGDVARREVLSGASSTITIAHFCARVSAL